jgi:mannose-6-phosphate isomerase
VRPGPWVAVGCSCWLPACGTNLQVLPTRSQDDARAEGDTLASASERRPWGNYEVLHDGPSMKIKVITVKPGCRLSYQSHEKRSEHWFVVEGVAEVVLDDARIVLHSGDTIDVPAGSRHRCANPGSADMTFVEVQTGYYFGEDDIVRYDDDYGRVS